MQASFSSAFLRGDAACARFLPATLSDREARSAAVRAAARPVSPALIAELRAQNAELGASPSRDENLDALARPGTIAVVTGQQVGLFLGPLFTFYKAASAIALSRRFTAEYGVRCVPVFWLQTEDHDFDEIRSCHLPPVGAEQPARSLSLAARPAEERVSVAHRRLGEEVTAVISSLSESLDALPQAREFLSLLTASYQPPHTLAQAFARTLASLFSDEGLVFIDPRRPAVAALAREVVARAITDQSRLAALLAERTRQLGEAGFAEQIALRPHTTLCFFHREVSGPRYRLERCGDGYTTPASTALLDEPALLALVREQPLAFSTSALLRPLLQDSLLPTAAYVGGPGEINYFAQLAPLYPHFGLPMPLIVPRARVRLVEPHARTLLGRVGLAAAEVEAPLTTVISRCLEKTRPAGPERLAEPSPEELRAALLGELGPRLEQLLQAEPGLADAVNRTRESVSVNIGKLVEKYRRLRVSRDQVLVDRVTRLQAYLYPAGAPQERHYSLPYYACQYGVAALKQKLFASLEQTGLDVCSVRELDL